MKLENYYDKKVKDYNYHRLNDFGNPLILNQVKENSTIFDIGCNTGNLAKGLKKFKKSTVNGVDISEKALKVAERYLDKSRVLNLEDFNKFPFSTTNYDYVVLADVLEHVRNPEEILKKIKTQLKFKELIISLPNVAFISVRLSLLLGNFNYTSYGILDDSHVKFYTLRSARKMFEDSGYSIINISPFPLTNKKLSWITHPLTRMFPTILGRQFVFTLKK